MKRGLLRAASDQAAVADSDRVTVPDLRSRVFIHVFKCELNFTDARPLMEGEANRARFSFRRAHGTALRKPSCRNRIAAHADRPATRQ